VKIRAVIFDVDGTLIDSMPIVIAGWIRAAKESGVSVTDEELKPLFGRAIPDIARRLIPGTDQTEFIERSQRYILDNLGEARLFPGAEETLAFLKEKELALGIVSGAPVHKIRSFLKAQGILDYFSAFVSGEDHQGGKPSGAPFVEACKLLGVEPSETLAVGDTSIDTTGAKKAGCVPIGVTSGGHTEGELKKAGAVKVLGTVAELPEYLEKELSD
jgi:HAD superfamily hydrolase (TIGR01549 family)